MRKNKILGLLEICFCFYVLLNSLFLLFNLDWFFNEVFVLESYVPFAVVLGFILYLCVAYLCCVRLFAIFDDIITKLKEKKNEKKNS